MYPIKRRYTIPHRLSDVIRLISVLSIHPDTFRSEPGLNRSLTSDPLSSTTKQWRDVIAEHPEFFRCNKEKDHFALVIRSYFPENKSPNDEKIGLRDPLTVDQTQQLITVAMNLHDKEDEQISRNNRWFQMLLAIIALSGPVFSSIYSSYSNKSIADKVDSLTSVIKTVDAKLKNAPFKFQRDTVKRK